MMSSLLETFLAEARECLQEIGEQLMQLEHDPADAELMSALFRSVHTLKGNSGLFEFPEMTRVLHAGEDLMDAVRSGRVVYSQALADRLLDAMDFVGMLCDDAEGGRDVGASHAEDATRLALALRELLPAAGAVAIEGKMSSPAALDTASGAASAQDRPTERSSRQGELSALSAIPEADAMLAFQRASTGDALHWVRMSPTEDCFFSGEDPFFQARKTDGLQWGRIVPRESWPSLVELDAYRCILDFELLSTAPRDELDDHFRFTAEQVHIVPVAPEALILPQGDRAGRGACRAYLDEGGALLTSGSLARLADVTRDELARLPASHWHASALRWILLVLDVSPDPGEALGALLIACRPDTDPAPADIGSPAMPGASVPGGTGSAMLSDTAADALRSLIAAQRKVLTYPGEARGLAGRLRSVSAALEGCLGAVGESTECEALQHATTAALAEGSPAPLLQWLDGAFGALHVRITPAEQPVDDAPASVVVRAAGDARTGRRSEDTSAVPASIKVDQAKIDRLMNLIGEMVVAKNALPYLANRAESHYGARELSREIKSQYAVVNRIAEEMQDAIMQVRMLPVSYVFQRFPRLVRDTARKLGKDVTLLLEGEETEADKHIIEALSDPLIHIVRNSLDHGLELPEVRRAAGKPAAGTLTIRASQESDRVVIEVRDDGKGIDAAVIKRKAYEKGLIDEETLERLSDQEAVNLVFASGFSTADVISDLSGRGVGMDVVRSAVEKVNGTVTLESEKGKGTRIRISLPLSMAVSSVMIVESDGQLFGMPMDGVVETVRVARSAVHSIKQERATVLRGRVIPLMSLNSRLGISAEPRSNAADELAVLVVRHGDDTIGLLVDDFRETTDIILKPLTGVLAGLTAYSGSALMGDGSVLMVLNVRELLP